MVGYRLGIDLGTTYTAAAVWDGGRAESVPLGDVAAQVPSTVFLRDDGTMLFGDAALQRGITHPERLAREFKRSIGDGTPRLLGGTPVSAHVLAGRLLEHTVAEVVERHGGRPARVMLTYPANWGAYRLELLAQAVGIAGLAGADYVSEPAAAAAHFAATSRLDTDDLAAIYDLGGGTFDAAVVRRDGSTFTVLGQPQGIEQLGGVDFDAAVLDHVVRVTQLDPASFDPDDELTVVRLDQLRQECVRAKVLLSSDSEVTIPVDIPGIRTSVRLTRTEFEESVRPAVMETVAAFRRALQSASVTPEELRAVVLVGGSARIPLVREVLAGDLGRPVVLSPQPKHCVALGAAMLGQTAAPRPAPAVTRARVAGPSTPSAFSRTAPVSPTAAVSRLTGATTLATAGRPAGATSRVPDPRPGAEPRVRPADRSGVVAWLTSSRGRVTVGALLAALAVVLLSFVPNDGAKFTNMKSVKINGAHVTRARTHVGVAGFTVGGLSGATASLTFKLFDVPVVSKQTHPIHDGSARFAFPTQRLLLVGPVQAELTDSGSHEFPVDPKSSFVRSIPGAFVGLGALFVTAYVESVLRGMRRRRRRRPSDTIALTVLGGLSGVLLTVVAWGAANQLPTTFRFVSAVAVGAVAGGLACAAIQPNRTRGVAQATARRN